MTRLAFRLAIAVLAGAAIGCGSRSAPRACDSSAASVASAADYLVARDNVGDLPGVLAGYTDDATWYPPEGPPLTGLEAIRHRYEQLFSDYLVTLRSETLEARGDGRLGFVIGVTRGTLTARTSGSVVSVHDRFVAIVRCVNGGWKVSHLVWARVGQPG